MVELESERKMAVQSSPSASPEPAAVAFKTRLQQFINPLPLHMSPQVPRMDRTPSKLQPGEHTPIKTENGTPRKVQRGARTPIKSEDGKSRKRPSSQIEADDSVKPTPKRKRTSQKEKSKNDPYEPENKLVDSLRPGLILVMIGLNPGLKTAETGHAYSHHSNRFWPLLHESGVTPKKHKPEETHDLQDLYGIGNTNICARASRDGSALSKEEKQEGAVILDAKIRKLRPEAVCIVGKGIWEAIWLAKFGKKQKKDEFHWGWQDEAAWLGRTQDDDGKLTWSGARTFVATSTSGLDATLKPAAKLEIWKPLGEWFTERRKRENDGEAEKIQEGGDEL